MVDKEKKIAQTIENAIADLPDEKKQYFMGFAEGVAAMADQAKAKSGEKVSA